MSNEQIIHYIPYTAEHIMLSALSTKTRQPIRSGVSACMQCHDRQTTMDDHDVQPHSYYGLNELFITRNTACKHLRLPCTQRNYHGTHLFERGAPRPQLGGCYWVSRDEEGCSVTPHDVFLVHLMTSNSVPPRNIGKCYIDAKFQHDALTAAMTSRYANFRICLKPLLQIPPNFIPKHS